MMFGKYAVVGGLMLAAASAGAQSLTVLPVSIQMVPGQSASTLTIINASDSETSVQVRAFAWSQIGDDDTLTASPLIVASPPIATIPARGAQIVRLVLRKPPVGKEGTYRIIVDQIPPPAAPGTVRIALRLSIPVFALPKTRALPRLAYRIERKDGKAWLVAANDGDRHETLRTVALSGGLTPMANISPYVLAGVTRRWPLDVTGKMPAVGEAVRLTAIADSGVLNEPVSVVMLP